MSAIADIFTAIGEMVVGTTKVRNLGEIKLQVRLADVPIRMLLPNPRSEGNFVAIGTTSSLRWALRDLCLWAPTAQGTGLPQYAEEMAEYIRQYALALKALRAPTSQSYIAGVSYAIGPITWGETEFWAVDVNLEIEEVF
jgi:hypothetical protein